MKAALALLALAGPVAAIAQPAPQTIYVTMTDSGFAPRQIVMQSGAPYVLRVTNRSDKGHNFTQEAFFRDARVDRADRYKVAGGKLVLDAHHSAVIHLLAPRNRPGAHYRFSSTVVGDAASDYRGVIRIR